MTTVQGLPKKFDQKKILKVIKKKFACNGTIVNDTEMGEVIQLQGDQRKDVQEFLVDKKEGLELDAKTIKVRLILTRRAPRLALCRGLRLVGWGRWGAHVCKSSGFWANASTFS